MFRFWKSLISDRNQVVRRFNLAAVFLLCVSSLAVTASSPQQTLGNSHYVLTPEWSKRPVCVGMERQLVVTLKFEIHEKIGSTEEERGRVKEFWYLPGKTIKLLNPTIGNFTSETPAELGGGPEREFVTDPTGRARSTFTAEKVGEQTILLKTSWVDEKTHEEVKVYEPLKIIVKKCIPTTLLNMHYQGDLGEGMYAAWGTGGGEAQVDEEGNLSGEGDLTMTEMMVLPKPYCTDAISSGQAPFKIGGKLNEESLDLKFEFSDLNIPSATATCTAGGVSVPLEAIPANSGDPGDEMGFHNVQVSADGGSVYFPIKISGLNGGTTLVVFMVPEETATSNIDPLDPLAMSSDK